jgi:type I restriction enzyme S subunit
VGIDPAAVPELRYLGLENIEANTTKILGSVPASEVRSTSYHFPPGSTLYSRLRPYLNKVATADFDGIGSGELIIFPPEKHLAPGFLRYLLNQPAFVEFTATLDTGDRPRVNWDGIRQFPCGLPPRAEQERIVAAIEEELSRLDAGVATLERTGVNLKRMRAAAYRLLDREASDLGTSQVLSDVTEFIVDGDHNPPKRTASGIPYLTAKHVKRGRISIDGASRVSQADFERLRRRYDPRGGDVLVTCVGTLGEIAVVPMGLTFAADRNLAAIRPAEALLPAYLEAVLRSPRQQTRLTAGSGSTAQPHLYLKDLRQLDVPVPSSTVQKELVTALDEELAFIDRLEVDLKRALDRGSALRASILSAAFSGNLVPQDPRDDPATALIERIAAERGVSAGHKPGKARSGRRRTAA